jgi:hypothetical protein
MEAFFMLAGTICAWRHGAFYHFYFCSEDGSTYSGVRTTASVDINWYYTATDCMLFTQTRGLKREKEKGN